MQRPEDRSSIGFLRRWAVVLCIGVAAFANQLAVADDRPNIVLIMVDDMGFSDLGCYGGEVETPNLDAMASSGLRFTQFYNCAKCETTRATLISGQYHPAVKIAKLQNCVTLAQVARQAGYTPLMTGKWHLSGNPIDWGFDRYFGHLSGACNFFKGDETFRLDREKFHVPKTGFYTTDANTDYAIRFLRDVPDEQPFFLYIAYNAPHYPLHAPREDVVKYRGRFSMGWDQLREQRLQRLKQLGIVPPETALPPRPDDVPAWDSLTPKQQATQQLMMEAYAAMIDRVDQNIGRLVKELKGRAQYDNTLILFLSDNGACPFQRTTPITREQNLMPWDPESYWTYDKGWAHACNTPFREYKRNQHEGGITTPLIAHWPEGIEEPGRITHQPGHLVDVMATLIDLTAGSYSLSRDQEPTVSIPGRTLTPIFQSRERPLPRNQFFTFYGLHNALRSGHWKLVNIEGGPWELYDLREGRQEIKNVADEHPDRVRAMKSAWQRLADQMGLKKKQPKKKRKKPKPAATVQ